VSQVPATTDSVFGLPLPLELGRTPRQRVTDHESGQPGMGFSASYVNALYSATLYIYDLGIAGLPDDATKPAAVAHFESCIQDVYRAELAAGRAVECRQAFNAGIQNADGQQLLIARFGYSGDTDRYRTFLHFTTRNGKFIKLRTTFQETSNSAASLTDTVMRSYLDLIWPSSSNFNVGNT